MLYIIKYSIGRLKKKNIFLMVQFFAGFFVLFFSMSFIYETCSISQQVQTIVPGNALQVSCIDEEAEMDVDEGKKQIKKIEHAVERIRNEMKIKLFMYDVLEFKENEADGSSVHMKAVMPHYDADIKYDLIEGSADELLNYNGQDVVPVIVSEKMSENYPVGSQYRAEEITGGVTGDPDKTFIVKGVFSKKMSYFSANCSFCLDALRRNEDMMFFVPEMNRPQNIISYESNMIYIPQEDTDEAARKKIDEVYSENDLSAEILSVDEQLQQQYDGKKMMLFVSAFFSIVLLALTSLGCMGTVLASIMNRVEEFGVYIALGFTRRRLELVITGELVCICLFAFILAFALFETVVGKLNFIYAGELGLQVMGTAVLAFIVCLMLSLIIPLGKLRSMAVTDMVEGR